MDQSGKEQSFHSRANYGGINVGGKATTVAGATIHAGTALPDQLLDQFRVAF